MKINHIKISNILGIDELEFSPGGFTSIEGQNGVGKTSVLEAIKAALSTGHDATLLRAGAEKGEVVFVLDDGVQISKKVSASTSTTEVRGADGKKIPRPAEAISRLIDMMSVNPVEFLTAKKAERAKVLLESMPLEINCEELSAASGITVKAQPGLHALAVIDQVRTQVFNDRTGTNRAIKEKEATINQLRLAMPDAIEGVIGNEDELRSQLDAANTAWETERTRIATKLDGMRTANAASIEAIRTKLAEDIANLRDAAEKAIDEFKTTMQKTEALANTQREKTLTKFNETTEPIKTALSNIAANRNLVAKREQALDTVKQMETELKGLIDDAAKQTQSLADIDAYKIKLLSSLPIPGIEIKDGEIYKGNIPLDRLNTAEQVNIAVQVAKLRAGELGVVCVDRVESLDSETLKHFQQAVNKSGLQLFITRVSDGEFTVNTD